MGKIKEEHTCRETISLNIDSNPWTSLGSFFLDAQVVIEILD